MRTTTPDSNRCQVSHCHPSHCHDDEDDLVSGVEGGAMRTSTLFSDTGLMLTNEQ